MEKNEQIKVNQRNGNLHINVEGLFSPETATLLTTVMTRSYEGRGNIFIHTEGITEIAFGSRFALNSLVDICDLPSENIYYIGEKGLDLGHDKGRVIVHKKKNHGNGGCGRCKNCTCGEKGEA